MSHVQNPHQRGNLNLPTIKHPPSTMLSLDCERHLHYTPRELKLKPATNKKPFNCRRKCRYSYLARKPLRSKVIKGKKGGLDRRLPERKRLNVMTWSHVRGQPVRLCFQVCLQRLNFSLNACYTGTSDVTRSKPTSTWSWESKPP